MCGATFISLPDRVTGVGLSPRVRGNHNLDVTITVNDRSIPACAGQPTKMMSIVGIGMVYPRVCGATLAHGIPGRVGRGLSPRVRGNLPSAGGVDANRRSIPACAGQPVSGLTANPPFTVYPRVCGATFISLPDRVTGVGLSPRVRGNPMAEPSPARRQRSIPACAGQPPEIRFRERSS